MDIFIQLLQLFGILCIAFVVGKLLSKINLPSILGWLITGMVFGPCLVGLASQDLIDATYYKIIIKCFECFAGVMIGSEINFKKLKSFGKQITVITLFQSLGTFLVVSLAFCLIFHFTGVPIYLGFIFGGIALATAPAPVLSIVDQYKTKGPVTSTLVPMAALDDIIGVIVFFTVISIVSGLVGGEDAMPVYGIILMVLMPFVIGISIGFISCLIGKYLKGKVSYFVSFILSLLVCFGLGIICDIFLFKSFALNYLLIGMAFSATWANLAPDNKQQDVLKWFAPILSFSLIIVIVNLGMPLDYRSIAGTGIYTLIYIVFRSVGKIGGAALGGVVSKAQPTVKKFLGLTLLPHSGVSLVFAGIAINMLSGVDNESVKILQGTIAAAAIINEIIAVIVAKFAFKWAGEIPQTSIKKTESNPLTK